MNYFYNNQNLKLKRQALRNNLSKPEQVLWYWLRGSNLQGYKFRRQYSISGIILDFYCPKLRLAIEVDGDSHFVDSYAVEKDKKRDYFLKKQDIKVLRFTNYEVIDNIEGVIYKISQYLS